MKISNRNRGWLIGAMLMGAAAMPVWAQGSAPAAAATKPVPALGPGSVAEFDVQRLVTPNAKPGPNEKWQQIHEKRTVVARAGDTLEVRVEEDFGAGTQPSVHTEKIAAVPDLPTPRKAAADGRAPAEPNQGGGVKAKGIDGMPQRTWAGRETVTTPAGAFECTRVAVEIVQMSSGTHIDEWYAAGLPWPVKSSSVTGAGATHFVKSELVKLERK
jgi:hypothetical protein